MTIWPQVTVKDETSNLVIGELVRVKDYRTIYFGVVANWPSDRVPQNKFVVLFDQSIPGSQFVFYSKVPNGSITSISYGRDYHFRLDHRSDGIEIDGSDNAVKSGAVVLSPDKSFLHVTPSPNTNDHDKMYMDLSSFDLTHAKAPRNNIIIPRWSLFLGQPDQHRIGDDPLVTFEAA